MKELIRKLCESVEKYAGIEVRTARQFEYLADRIESRTGVSLSPTTLKRLWGYLNEDVRPRESTLDVLATFCGWRNFKDFTEGRSPEIESGNVGAKLIRADQNVRIGDEVRVFWHPGRVCVIRYLGGGKWRVMEAEGTRLAAGDTFTCQLIVEGEPLYLDNLAHEGKEYGVYVCGRKSGITFEAPCQKMD